MSGSHGGLSRGQGWALATGAGGAAALVAVGRLVGSNPPVEVPVATTAALAVSGTAIGGLVLGRHARHRFGVLMLVSGLTATAALVALTWTGVTAAAWVGDWLWWPPLGLLVAALLVFPDGRLPSRRWRPVAALVAVAAGTATLALAAASGVAPGSFSGAGEPPLGDSAREDLQITLYVVAFAGVVVVLLCLPLVLASLWARRRGAAGQERAQVTCLALSGVVLGLGLALDFADLRYAWVVTAVAVPIGISAAVLRYSLYDLDLVLNRTLVWTAMTAMVLAGFTALVLALKELLFGDDGQGAAALAATGLIAVTFEPLHQRVQHGVDHLLYGERDEPYEVLARLGEHLGHTMDPSAVLPALARTIVTSLQVPYVAVDLDEPTGTVRAAEHGRRVPTVVAYPMVAHGSRVGQLLVGTRSSGGRFTGREERLLGDVARQAAVAAEATRLVRDLQGFRERLVLAREEERRRLRRDLHDGLGPSLVGMSMQARAARRLFGPDDRPAVILDALIADLRTCTVEVRQLVDALRPPMLDQGLECALRAEARRLSTAGLDVTVTVDGDLRRLPAAVEVAAYRIVAEALTNVARHAGARSCAVTVRRSTELGIDVVDDGVGIAAHASRGVGLSSMRERAAEVGGECTVTAERPRGTRVAVRLPCVAAAPRLPAPAAAADEAAAPA